MAGPVAAAIDHEQRFTCVGQRNDQWMITPLAFVIDVHALFALAGGLDHCAVGIDHGFIEERSWLLPPDLQSYDVEDVLQTEDGGIIEAPAEVARRGRIGNASSAEGVEVRLVIAEQFEMFQACPTGQQVVSDVEHVIGIVVGQMDFQHPQMLVDQLVESQPPHQQVHSPDSAVGRGPCAIGDFIMDVRGGHDGPVISAVVVLVQPLGDPPLASFDLFSYPGTHSKTSVRWGGGFL